MRYEELGVVTIDITDDNLPVTDIRDIFVDAPRSVLWQREGLFRLVSRQICQNAIDAYESWAKMSHPIGLHLNIRWEQGIDVDPRIARILLGERPW